MVNRRSNFPLLASWDYVEYYEENGNHTNLGIVLGITLVSPQLLNAYSVATTKAAEIPFWDFGFAQVNMIGYQAQVIPAMLAGFCLPILKFSLEK